MKKIIRLATDSSKGHCYTPRPTDSCLQSTVFVNSILANVVGDHYPTHCCGPSCHDGVASGGDSTVFIENKKIHRNGDSISCGDKASNGSNNVFSGGAEG